MRWPNLLGVLGALCALEAVAAAQPDTGEPEPPPMSPTAPSKPAAAATGISGVVESPDLEAPLAGATLTIIGTTITATTDDDGKFTLAAPPGSYTVRADFAGFKSEEKTVKVTASGPPATLDFKLATATLLNETIVVVGSRTPRTNLDSTAPVDVITAEEVQRSAQLETGRILAELEPSFISAPQTISDGTDHVDPAALRGLGPDQVLVLVNGKRRHKSALLNVNGTFGRGTVGTDLNAIAPGSIKRIEVLRDGAAAQYGSDAIAGVINIVTKDAVDEVDVTAESGITASGDGFQVQSSANGGWKLGDKGFLNVTGEFLHRDPTNRAGQYSGPIYNATDAAADAATLQANGLTRDDFKMRIGEAGATFGVGEYNMEIPFSDTGKVYSFGDISYRRGDAAGFYRYPYEAAQNVFQFYPSGFLPQIHTDIADTSVTVGIRQKGTWTVDASLTRGTSSFRFNIENSVNASLGTSSPTTFDAGTLQSTENVANLDLQRKLDTDAVKSATVVLGSEFRVENYKILAGDEASYIDGNMGDVPGAIPGSQVFPGFQPSNEVDRTRDSIGVYGGLETDITKALAVDAGGRFEAYSDFGQNVTGKLAARYHVLDSLSLRGAISTGFRAPSLQQLWFSNISTLFLPDPSSGVLTPENVLTSNNASPVTKAFGIPQLHEERSVNASGGVTFRPTENLSLTADGYFIRIDGRIVLTSQFDSTNPIVAGILSPFPGVSEAQFFANAVNTDTEGGDVVADYGTAVGDGTLTLTAAANFTQTKVIQVNLPRSLVDKFGANSPDLRTFFFDRAAQNRIEDAVPHQKGQATVRYALGDWSALARARYYGAVYFKPDNMADDETFGAKVLFDASVGYQATKVMRFTLGADNLLNTFPDKNTKADNISAGRFIYSRNVTQFGENGGFYYVKLELSFL